MASTASQQVINDWFWELREYLFKMGNIDILGQPNRIYNWDETGFLMVLHPTKVIASKGNPHMYQQGASTKAQITMLLTARTTTHYIPPLIIFPGKNFPTTFIKEFYRIFLDALWTLALRVDRSGPVLQLARAKLHPQKK